MYFQLLDACVWLLDAEMEGAFQFRFDKQLVYVRAKWTLPDRELLEVAAWTWAWSSNLYDAKVHWLWSSEPANANQVCCCTGPSERLPVYRIRQGSLCEAGTSKQDCLGFIPYLSGEPVTWRIEGIEKVHSFQDSNAIKGLLVLYRPVEGCAWFILKR